MHKKYNRFVKNFYPQTGVGQNFYLGILVAFFWHCGILEAFFWGWHGLVAFFLARILVAVLWHSLVAFVVVAFVVRAKKNATNATRECHKNATQKKMPQECHQGMQQECHRECPNKYLGFYSLWLHRFLTKVQFCEYNMYMYEEIYIYTYYYVILCYLQRKLQQRGSVSQLRIHYSTHVHMCFHLPTHATLLAYVRIY